MRKTTVVKSVITALALTIFGTSAGAESQLSQRLRQLAQRSTQQPTEPPTRPTTQGPEVGAGKWCCSECRETPPIKCTGCVTKVGVCGDKDKPIVLDCPGPTTDNGGTVMCF